MNNTPKSVTHTKIHYGRRCEHIFGLTRKHTQRRRRRRGRLERNKSVGTGSRSKEGKQQELHGGRTKAEERRRRILDGIYFLCEQKKNHIHLLSLFLSRRKINVIPSCNVSTSKRHSRERFVGFSFDSTHTFSLHHTHFIFGELPFLH